MKLALLLLCGICSTPLSKAAEDAQLPPQDLSVESTLKRAFYWNNLVRITPNDPMDAKLVTQCEASNAGVTVHEICKASENELLRVSYALSLLTEEWRTARTHRENLGGRKPDEIYRDLEVLVKRVQELRAAEKRSKNDAQQGEDANAAHGPG